MFKKKRRILRQQYYVNKCKESIQIDYLKIERIIQNIRLSYVAILNDSEF